MLALRTAPTVVRLSLAAVGVLLIAYAGELAFHFLPAGASEPFQKFATNIVFLGSAALCAARAFQRQGERAAWLMMALGLLMWGLGNLYFTLFQWDLTDIPTPSPADAGWLLFYPFIYVALVLLYRSRIRPRSAALWIDGAVGALAVGGLGAAIVFQAVLKSTGGSTAAIATDLSYPLADLMLLGLVVGVLAMTGLRRGGAWAWIAGGLAVFVVCDSLYLYGTAVGSYEAGVIYDAGWPAAALLVALGAWTPATSFRAEASSERRGILLPISFAGISLGLLIYDHFDRTNVVALVLASSCLVAVLARLAITFGDNRRMLASSRREASTDALTGLGNRRSLTLDLERVSAAASAQHPACLALFDLDGFKTYNDSFGHPAGDSMLTRLGGALSTAVASHGTAYRMGGDEFCVLTHAEREDEDAVLAAAKAALAEHGDGFAITCSYGSVRLPAEADGRRARPQPCGRAHVRAEEPRPRFGRAPVERRAAARAGRTSSVPRRSCLHRRRAGRGHRRPARPGADGSRGAAPRRGAARHGQGGHPGRDPRQAGAAGRRRVGVHAPPHDRRRAHPPRRAGPRGCGHDRALDA